MEYSNPFVQRLLPLLDEAGVLYKNTAALPPSAEALLEFAYRLRAERDIWRGSVEPSAVLAAMADGRHMGPHMLARNMNTVAVKLLQFPDDVLSGYGLRVKNRNMFGLAEAMSRAI